MTVSDLPTVNAVLNGTSVMLLTAGFWAVRRGRIRLHRVLMLSAFTVSTAFLVSYVTYHLSAPPVRFQGTGWMRPAYFTMLISHIVLAAALVPLAVVTVWRAWKGRFDAHRRLARWTLPIWLYVGVTGVLVYVALYRLYEPLHIVDPAGLTRVGRTLG